VSGIVSAAYLMAVETADFAAMLRRLIRAYARRVGEGDEVDLADMLGVAAVLDDAIAKAVATMRAQGHSWDYIGKGAGITRQGAFQRWGARPTSEGPAETEA
jgi:hypothetical protein